MPRKQLTIGIADDVLLEQALIEYNIKALKNTHILFRSTNGYDLLVKLQHFKPDIIILDIYMPMMNGWETIQELRKQNYSGKIICTTANYEPFMIDRLKEAGVHGFARKHNKHITKAITEVNEGRNYFDHDFTVEDVYLSHHHKPEIAELNGKEIEIINKLAHGKSSKEIADELGVYTSETIDTYIKNILDRFRLKNRTHLVSYALACGLIYNFDFLKDLPVPQIEDSDLEAYQRFR